MIIGVALQHPSGAIEVRLKPARHFNFGASLKGATQGFVDDAGAFLTRSEAAKQALLSGQVRQLSRPRLQELFSEDVW